jgi:tetratricopeptide (TPR) repeat protein
MIQNNSFAQSRELAWRYLLASSCLLFLLWAMWVTARDGFSSFLSRSVPADASGLKSLDRASELSPSDWRPYDRRASYLVNVGNFAEAERNFEQALVKSPDNYLLWLRLGSAREELGNLQGAEAAYQESIRLAPSYPKSHWSLGLLWLRTGHRDEAFSELNKAATRDQTLLLRIIDFAWEHLNGDAEAIRRAVNPQSAAAHVALANSFLAHGKLSEAMTLYRAAGELPESERRTLIAELLKARAYTQAYEMWAHWRGESVNGGPTSLNNGDFERSIDGDTLGFDWRSFADEKIRVVRDKDKPESGAYSLRLDFEGNSSPDREIVSQILVVQPGTKYTLGFAARSLQLITGGLPVVAVVDVQDGATLGLSKPLAQNQIEWTRQSIPFSTRSSTNAVTIIIKREQCSSSPCPAFGHAWFDNFICQRL